SHVGNTLFRRRMARALYRARLATTRVGTRSVLGAHDSARSPHARRCAVISSRTTTDRLPLGAAVELVATSRQYQQNRLDQSHLANAHDSARRMAGTCARLVDVA